MKQLDFIPNQKHITIHREMVRDSKKQERPYLIMYSDNIIEAMHRLTPNAFKIYIYLCTFRSYMTMAYSPEYISQHLNMCRDTARKALKELEENGYLYLGENQYKFYFYESPEIIKQEMVADYQERIKQLQDMILAIQVKE